MPKRKKQKKPKQPAIHRRRVNDSEVVRHDRKSYKQAVYLGEFEV